MPTLIPAPESARQDLAGLQSDVITMAELAQAMLADGARALLDGDVRRARIVQAQAAELAAMDETLETQALALLGRLRADPAALRQLAALLKLLTYLNRVGRYGFDIAHAVDRTRLVSGASGLFDPIAGMAADVAAMLEEILETLRNGRRLDLDRMLDLEDGVDEANRAYLEHAVHAMSEDPRLVRPATEAVLMARALERAADNICKMAEKLHYAATGERVVIR